MTTPRTEVSATSPVSKCPGGLLKPTGKRELLALKALDEDRLDDAGKHIAALPTTPAESRTWKLYLGGCLKLKTRELAEAEAAFLQAASVAFVWALGHEPQEASTAYRLAATALESAGMIQRRGERPGEAIATHFAAYQLRTQYGTIEEQWESALGQGMAHCLAKDHSAALKWQSRALDFAHRAGDARDRKLAMTYSQLAVTSRELGQFEEAVLAARSALEHWRAADPAVAAVAEAEFRLGDVLVAAAENTLEQEPPTATTCLHEAVDCLRSAGDSLAAFAGEHRRIARLCRDRLEFAERLLASATEK